MNFNFYKKNIGILKYYLKPKKKLNTKRKILFLYLDSVLSYWNKTGENRKRRKPSCVIAYEKLINLAFFWAIIYLNMIILLSQIIFKYTSERKIITFLPLIPN